MGDRIDLGGQWKLEGKDAKGERTISIQAEVPGFVHQDLQERGIIADPRVGYNAEECQWVEAFQWKYTKSFELEYMPAGNPILLFEGVDTFSEIYLNGVLLGRTDNMFLDYRFEVAGILEIGTNELVVSFSTIEEGIKGKPYRNYEAAFTNERVYVRRMQCTFGWDWVNRFVSYGIWRPISLQFEPMATISNVYVYTQTIDESGAAIRYSLEVGRNYDAQLSAKVTIRDPQGNTVWQKQKKIVSKTLELTADISQPELWWPAGYGEQPLYTVETSLSTSSGRHIQLHRVQFGIRTVRIQQLQDVPGSREAVMTDRIRAQFPMWDKNEGVPGSSFSLLVNGRSVFCKGANWVPVDPFPSRIDDQHYAHLLKLARDSHITMIRCWGGGIYEPEVFWNECDKLGLLVCQDFIMACGKYPEDDESWTATLRTEAECVIRKLRNHPSLVWWIGDNENGLYYDEEDVSYPGRKVAEKITGRLCAELDPSRPFLPTSPFGGSPNLSFTTGTAHITGVMLEIVDYIRQSELRNYRDYFQSFITRFCPEFPMFGTPELHTLRRFMSEEELVDPDYKMLEYHTKNHPGLVDFSLFRALLQLGDKLTPPANTVVERIGRMSFVQRELVRVVVESYRRNRYYSSGILFWMYNDCWPASGWSLVDYYGYPKGGYYGIKAASKPVIASIEREADSGALRCWVCSDLPQQIHGSGRLNILSLDKDTDNAIVWTTSFAFEVEAGESIVAMTIHNKDAFELLDQGHIAVMEIEGTFEANRVVWFEGRPADLQLPSSGARMIQPMTSDSRGVLKVTADRYAACIVLMGQYVFSDNYFELLPGEEREISYEVIHTMDAHEEGIRLYSWN